MKDIRCNECGIWLCRVSESNHQIVIVCVYCRRCKGEVQIKFKEGKIAQTLQNPKRAV